MTQQNCAGCGAPLDADQRYCLQCGTRRGEPRVDVLRELGVAPAASAAAPVVAASSGPTIVDRAGGPAGIAAVLLAAVGVGLLIGRTDSAETRTVVQRAPVVNVQAPTGAAAAAPAAAPADAAASSDAGSSDVASGDSSSSSSSSSTKAPSKAEVNKAAQSTKAAQDKIKNAPKETSTGGKPPAKDDKAAGGGSDAESIG